VFDVRKPFGAGKLWAQTGGCAAEKEEEKEGDGGWCRDAGECWWDAAAGLKGWFAGRGGVAFLQGVWRWGRGVGKYLERNESY